MSYAPAHRPALGATAIASPPPSEGRPQAPLYPIVVGNNGGWLAVRSSPAQGSCGVSGYPCKHPGVDLNAKPGTIAVAPEDGVIVAAADGSAAPWRGYGPWLVVIRGNRSGMFHLLAHLDLGARAMGPIGLRVAAGTPVGRVSNYNHVHWELRRLLTPPAGGSNLTNNVDPLAWLSRARSGGLWLLGLAGGAAVLGLLYLRRR